MNSDRIFPDLGGDMLSITCRNHPTARYLMKNMRGRNLHFISPPEEALAIEDMQEREDAGFIGIANLECPCLTSDLILVDDGRQVFGGSK